MSIESKISPDIEPENRTSRFPFKRALARAATIPVVVATVLTLGAIPAFAAGAGDGSQASDCGAGHGAFADVNGNFGFLGAEGGTPGYHNGAVGQEQGATGYNNSNLCGNP